MTYVIYFITYVMTGGQAELASGTNVPFSYACHDIPFIRKAGAPMDSRNQQEPPQLVEEQASLTAILRKSEESCRDCNPLTPITCLSGCKAWKIKNEFRSLHAHFKDPSYSTHLLNTLKNARRLQTLQLISKEHQTLSRLQQTLKIHGYHHSQQTILQEYLNPLAEAGLIDEVQNLYHATMLGNKINEIMHNFRDLANILPSHSKGYEEKALDYLQASPRTYEEFQNIMPTESVSRVIKRLQVANLVKTDKENNYIFFFKTKRSPDKESLSSTETRVYRHISDEGIPARKIAEKAELSLRRVYKYLRKLKGKKLVFIRKKPKLYALTENGFNAAATLDLLHRLIKEASTLTMQFDKEHEINELMLVDAHQTKTKNAKV
jgi:predicted transcriptional regulator